MQTITEPTPPVKRKTLLPKLITALAVIVALGAIVGALSDDATDSDRPSWANDANADALDAHVAWSADAATLTNNFADMLNAGDAERAAQLADRIVDHFSEAPHVPDALPFAAPCNAVKSAGIATFAQMRTALQSTDAASLDQANVTMQGFVIKNNACIDAMQRAVDQLG